MADDKTKVGGLDRATVAAGEGYELDYFAQKHGLSRDDARELIEKHGNDRRMLDAAAEGLKLGGRGRGGADFNSNAKI